MYTPSKTDRTCLACLFALLANSAAARGEQESEYGGRGRLFAKELTRPIHMARDLASPRHVCQACLTMNGTRWSSTPLFASVSATTFHLTSRAVRRFPSLLARLPIALALAPW